MKFRVERDALADAVAWAARSLSTRPTIPVLAGLLLDVTDSTLSISGFDLEASTQVDLEVAAAAPGTALVSGRLLADIARSLPPHPVDVAVDGPRLTIACGSARFTLPMMPVEDYPKLPQMPTTAGTVPGAVVARSLAQSDELTIALSASAGAGDGIIGFSGVTGGRASRATTRLLDPQFPPYRTLLPTEWSATAEVAVAPFVEAVKRVALLADRSTPVRLEFAEGGVSLTAGGDDEGRAEEHLEIVYEGEP